MDTPRPMLAHPSAPVAATASGGASRAGMLLLGLLVLAGVWSRYGDRVASMLPAQLSGTPTQQGLVELAMLPASETAQAIAAMGLPASQARILADAVQRRRLRLVRMPLFNADPAVPDAAAHVVRVSAGGYATTVHLAPQPIVVTLPIGPVGSVLFSPTGAARVAVGSITLSGPVRFPDTGPGQVLDVGVIAQ